MQSICIRRDTSFVEKLMTAKNGEIACQNSKAGYRKVSARPFGKAINH